MSINVLYLGLLGNVCRGNIRAVVSFPNNDCLALWLSCMCRLCLSRCIAVSYLLWYVPHVLLIVLYLRARLSFIYLLTEVSPSWEAANCAATQELPSVLRNPKVHRRVLKSPPLVPILSQINTVHTTLSYLSKINFNIIHPRSSWSS
jgi:hypothetical protein